MSKHNLVGKKHPVGRLYRCVDGPMVGESLYLTTGSTLPFNYKMGRGQYVKGESDTLYWRNA